MEKCFWLVIILVMVANVFHPLLWGPDEPREAEIARHIYESGNCITPYFCSLPFVEKPPLYHDLIAGMFFLTGGASPEAARLVSAVFGILMIGCVFALVKKFFDLRSACIAALLLMSMPQFYRAAHWILLDIGVGAFCTAALACFVWYVCRDEDKPAHNFLLTGFYLACAGAFLTKSIAGIFSIGVVVIAYILIRRRWDLLKELLVTPAILCFLLPAGLWVWLFYLEGGVYYLHEHFINNTIGRFLHINMTLDGSPMMFTDVGNSSGLFFYLERLPGMLGAAILVLPFGLYEALSRAFAFRREVKAGATASKWRRMMDFLLIAPEAQRNEAKYKEFFLILALWALLPPILLSLSSIKEVTYVLPSYAAVAILGGVWLSSRLPAADKHDIAPALFLMVLAVAAAFCLAPYSFAGYMAGMSALLVLGAGGVVFWFVRRSWGRAVFLLLGVLICGVVFGNTPQVMRKTRLNRKCFIEFSEYVWERVKARPLVICGGDESLRGSIPFYGQRGVRVVKKAPELLEGLKSDPSACGLMLKRSYDKAVVTPDFQALLTGMEVVEPPFPHLVEEYVLLIPLR